MSFYRPHNAPDTFISGERELAESRSVSTVLPVPGRHRRREDPEVPVAPDRQVPRYPPPGGGGGADGLLAYDARPRSLHFESEERVFEAVERPQPSRDDVFVHTWSLAWEGHPDGSDMTPAERDESRVVAQIRALVVQRDYDGAHALLGQLRAAPASGRAPGGGGGASSGQRVKFSVGP